MKRLFGLIGFTFLFVLSAVFYSDFNEIVFAIIGSLGLISVVVGIFLGSMSIVGVALKQNN